MNIRYYGRALESAVKGGKRFLCQYCASETLTVGSVCVCSNCEMPVYFDADVLRVRSPHTFATISEIKSAIEKNDYDAAIKLYDDLYQNGKDAGYLYAKALLSIKESNSSIAQIRYDRQGFMEENTPLRDGGAKLASSARASLSEVIKACESQLKNEERPPLGATYLTFICHIKLSNLREASVISSILNKIDSAYLGPYSRMVLSLNLHKPEDTIKNAERLLTQETFSINSLFYIALAKFDRGMYKESKEIVNLLKPYLPSSALDSLSYEITEAESI